MMAMNPSVHSTLSAVNAALDTADHTSYLSNAGDGLDGFPIHDDDLVRDGSLVPVTSMSIEMLRRENPELENVGFIKMDCEGHERKLVPALREFLLEILGH